MANRTVKKLYMRGHILVLKSINRFLDVMIASWHGDWVLALMAVLMALGALILVGVGLWFFSNAVSYLLLGMRDESLYTGALAVLCLLAAKLGMNGAYGLMPFDVEADED